MGTYANALSFAPLEALLRVRWGLCNLQPISAVLILPRFFRNV